MATSAAPACIRIKRKRDEVSLPEFVLASNKRPSLLERLSLSDEPAAEKKKGAAPAPPAASTVRYQLVGTAVRRGGAAVRDPAALALAREHALRQARGVEKYRKLALLRNTSGSSEDSVLELQTCSSADAQAARRATGAAAKPKLRPFGPPLPATNARTEAHVETSSGGMISEAELWADAGQAAIEAAAEAEKEAAAAAAAAAEESGFVYDEYVVQPDGENNQAAAEGAASGAGAGGFDGWSVPEIYWDDELAAEYGEDLRADGGEDSDSNGEVDYPDEESDGVDSDN